MFKLILARKTIFPKNLALFGLLQIQNLTLIILCYFKTELSIFYTLILIIEVQKPSFAMKVDVIVLILV